MTGVALCFPGQGSQAPGMADGLLEHPLAADLLEVAAGMGLDLRAVLEGGADELRPTQAAQPALLLVELVLTAALPAGVRPVAVAGHSAGEYAAAAAAAALAPAEAMRLAIERGRAMAASAGEGSMAAILGLDEPAVEAACEEARSGGVEVVVANVNAPGEVIVSGSEAGLEAAGAAARARGARRIVPLRVSGAFHSPLMAAAAARFEPVLAAAAVEDPRIPLVSNVDGEVVRDAGDLRRRLLRQLTEAVRWSDCVRRLVSLGAGRLVEVGPGHVLTKLARRTVPEVETASAGSLGDVAALLEGAPAAAGTGGG